METAVKLIISAVIGLAITIVLHPRPSVNPYATYRRMEFTAKATGIVVSILTFMAIRGL